MLEAVREASLARRPEAREPGLDGRLARLPGLSLACREGGFAARHIGNVEVVLPRSGTRALGPAPGYRGEA